MKTASGAWLLGLAVAGSSPSFASSPITAEGTLERYCEPLIAGSTASEITEDARANGFQPDVVGGHPVLVQGEFVLGISDDPRVCMVQAPPSMTFAQGLSLVDAWAARHSGARRGAATQGPDGAPVRLWAVPEQEKYLLVSEQTTALGHKVLNFIMAPLPKGF